MCIRDRLITGILPPPRQSWRGGLVLCALKTATTLEPALYDGGTGAHVPVFCCPEASGATWEFEFGRSAIDDKTRSGGVPESGKDLAVSYTHLRAHETVLDLVCRLLLEK